MTKDLNDRHLEGTLPNDPASESVRVEPDSSVRVSTLRLVRDQVDATKLPTPSDVIAESALLGALLWAGTYAPTQLHSDMVKDLVTEETFFTPAHGDIFAAIATRAASQAPTDVVSVQSVLIERGLLSRAGGTEYLEALTTGAYPTSEPQLRGHAESIRNMWARRRLIETAREVVSMAKLGKATVAECCEKARSTFDEVTSMLASTAAVVTAKHVASNLLREQLSPRAMALETGVAGLQSLLGGLRQKKVTVIAARTSVGKSSFAYQVTENAVMLNRDVGAAYVTLEMEPEEFVRRAASARARVDGDKIRRNLMNERECGLYAKAISEIAVMPIVFGGVEERANTLTGALAFAEQAASSFQKQGKRLGVIAVDHIHLIKPAGKESGLERRDFMASVSRWLLGLAKRFDCHVIALAQIAREAERQGADTTPKMSHIKESSSIEDDAENIVIIHRRRDKSGLFLDENASFIVAKARNTQIGRFEMSVEPRFCRFSDVEGYQ